MQKDKTNYNTTNLKRNPQVNPLDDLNNMYSTMQLPKITIPSERGM
jgi:hypothetical protein